MTTVLAYVLAAAVSVGYLVAAVAVLRWTFRQVDRFIGENASAILAVGLVVIGFYLATDIAVVATAAMLAWEVFAGILRAVSLAQDPIVVVLDDDPNVATVVLSEYDSGLERLADAKWPTIVWVRDEDAEDYR